MRGYCLYCRALIDGVDSIPNDEDQWDIAKLQHRPDCPWLLNCANISYVVYPMRFAEDVEEYGIR